MRKAIPDHEMIGAVRSLSGAACCLECLRAISAVEMHTEQNVLTEGCRWCGRVKDLHAVQLVQAREYGGEVVMRYGRGGVA